MYSTTSFGQFKDHSGKDRRRRSNLWHGRLHHPQRHTGNVIQIGGV